MSESETSRRVPEIRALHPDDLDALARLREVAFFDQMDWSDVHVRQHHSQMLHHRRGAFVDGELVSTASWMPFQVYMDGVRTAMGGLASVSTPLEHRKQGYVEALLHEGLTTLHEQGVGWSLEYPFDPRYYRRYGWACVPNGACVKVPPDWFAREGLDDHGMRRAAWGDVLGELDQIYEAFASRHTFAMVRGQEPRPSWQNLCGAAIWQPREPVLYMREDAYVVCALERGASGLRVEVLDHGYSSARGRRAIFGLLGRFDATQVGDIEMQLPPTDPLTLSWGGRRMPQPEVLQARIVDVVAALDSQCSRVLDPFVMEVRDAFCAWNDGLFDVSATGVRGREGGGAEPAVSLDVSTLAQVVSGAVSVQAAAALDEARGEVALLEQVCHTQPVYMSLADYF